MERRVAMPNKEETLEAIRSYGNMLGEERIRRLSVSDEWSDARTLVVLLLKNPDDQWYRSCLDDEERRNEAFRMARVLAIDLDQGEP